MQALDSESSIDAPCEIHRTLALGSILHGGVERSCILHNHNDSIRHSLFGPSPQRKNPSPFTRFISTSPDFEVERARRTSATRSNSAAGASSTPRRQRSWPLSIKRGPTNKGFGARWWSRCNRRCRPHSLRRVPRADGSRQRPIRCVSGCERRASCRDSQRPRRMSIAAVRAHPKPSSSGAAGARALHPTRSQTDLSQTALEAGSGCVVTDAPERPRCRATSFESAR